MKKISLLLIIALSITSNIAFAQEESKPSYIYTSEKVPGVDCQCVKTLAKGTTPEEIDEYWTTCSGDVTKRLYKCEQKTGLQGFMDLFRKMMKWVVQIAMLLGVLAIAALGVAWAVAWGDDPEYKKKLKDWVVGIMIGLIILFMFPYILRFLAPWIFQ